MRSVFFPRLVNGPFGDPVLYVRLAHRGEALLFDCGDLHPLTPRELLKIRAVFISHAHIDHLVGFGTLLRTFLYQDTCLSIYGPPGTIERIAGHLAGYTWNLIEDYPLILRVREWGIPAGRETVFRAASAFAREPETAWECPGGLLHETGYYRVRTVPLDHGGIVSLAFVIEEPLHIAIHKDALERQGFRPGPWLTRFKDLVRQQIPVTSTRLAVPLEAGGEVQLPIDELAAQIAHLERGMKLCYVTDAAPTQENQDKIAALAADSHLLAIEATFADTDAERARTRNHLTARLAGQLGRRAQAARLLVFHHSPRYQDRPELLRNEAEAAFREETAEFGRPD
jgi:ribonuclease Z